MAQKPKRELTLFIPHLPPYTSIPMSLLPCHWCWAKPADYLMQVTGPLSWVGTHPIVLVPLDLGMGQPSLGTVVPESSVPKWYLAGFINASQAWLASNVRGRAIYHVVTLLAELASRGPSKLLIFFPTILAVILKVYATDDWDLKGDRAVTRAQATLCSSRGPHHLPHPPQG